MEHRAKTIELLGTMSCWEVFQGTYTDGHVRISSLIGIYCYNLRLFCESMRDA
jgi:hypothetical protein